MLNTTTLTNYHFNYYPSLTVRRVSRYDLDPTPRDPSAGTVTTNPWCHPVR